MSFIELDGMVFTGQVGRNDITLDITDPEDLARLETLLGRTFPARTRGSAFQRIYLVDVLALRDTNDTRTVTYSYGTIE